MSKTKMGVIALAVFFLLEPALAFVAVFLFGAWLILSLFITQLKDSAADLERPY